MDDYDDTTQTATFSNNEFLQAVGIYIILECELQLQIERNNAICYERPPKKNHGDDNIPHHVGHLITRVHLIVFNAITSLAKSLFNFFALVDQGLKSSSKLLVIQFILFIKLSAVIGMA
jgi:hypothetical protein